VNVGLLMMIDVVGLVVLGVGGSPWLKVLYIGSSLYVPYGIVD
jgi:hypothetical protein